MISTFSHLSALCFFAGFRLSSSFIKYEALVGDTFVFKCKINDWDMFHSIVWSKDENHVARFGDTLWVSENGKYNISRDSYFVFLSILTIQFQDAGVYKCETFHTGTSGKVNKDEFGLQVQGEPTLHAFGDIFTEGDDIVAICCVNITSNYELPEIQWSIENNGYSDSYEDAEREQRQKYQTHHELCNGVLFRSTRQQHDQHLTCQVLNQLNMTDKVVLKILYHASVSLEVSSFHVKENNDFNIKENSNVTIICKSDANPPTNASLEVKRNNVWTSLETNKPLILLNGTTSLNEYTFENVTRMFSGYYRCAVAYNNITYYAVKNIVMLYAPQISLMTPSSVRIPLNGSTSIECKVASNPLPDVTLQKTFNDDLWITLNEVPTLISKQGTISTWRFQLEGVDEKMSGFYRCSATNEVGFMAFTKTVNIVVLKTEKSPVPKKDPWSESFLIYLTFFVAISAAIVVVNVQIHKRRIRALKSSFTISLRRFNRSDNCARSSYPDVVTMPSTTRTFPARALPNKPKKADEDDHHFTASRGRHWNRTSLDSASSEGLHSLHLDSCGYATVNETSPGDGYMDMK